MKKKIKELYAEINQIRRETRNYGVIKSEELDVMKVCMMSVTNFDKSVTGLIQMEPVPFNFERVRNHIFGLEHDTKLVSRYTCHGHHHEHLGRF